MDSEGAHILRPKEVLAGGPRLIGLDGIGGTGKSHVCRVIAERMRDDGLKVVTPKIAGLGESPRVQWLKKIMEHRHGRTLAGDAPQKYIEDRKKDRLFRLAIRQQVKEFRERLTGETCDVAILDRTPLMSWVFATSTDPKNPYLDEIWEEALQTTDRLGLTKVILMDVEPEIAFARIIARYAVNRDNKENLILEACTTIGANPQQHLQIKEEVLRLIQYQIGLKQKPFESWDLIPLEVAHRERESHKIALERARQFIGLDYTIVDASGDLENVVTMVYNAALQKSDTD